MPIDYDLPELGGEIQKFLDPLSPSKRITPPESIPSRGRGFITKSDREFLCGDWSTDAKNEAQVRAGRKADIRNRTINALRDFPFLLALDAQQRTKIYEEIDRETIRESLGALIAFLYLASGKDRGMIGAAVGDGIYTAEQMVSSSGPKKSEIEDILVSIDFEYAPDVDEVYQQFKQDGPSLLSSSEIGALIRQKQLTDEELAELNKPGHVRKAEEIAPKIEQAIEESDASTYEEWKSSLEPITPDGEPDDSDIFFNTIGKPSIPEEAFRDALDEKYLDKNVNKEEDS